MLKGKDTASAQVDWHTIDKKLDVFSQNMENGSAPHLEEDCLTLFSGTEGVVDRVEIEEKELP